MLCRMRRVRGRFSDLADHSSELSDLELRVRYQEQGRCGISGVRGKGVYLLPQFLGYLHKYKRNNKKFKSFELIDKALC